MTYQGRREWAAKDRPTPVKTSLLRDTRLRNDDESVVL
jgi:hypothetical protein